MAYDPSAIPGLHAWYKLDNGTLTTDSSGKGNTLTNPTAVINDTGDYKEGDACADFEVNSNQYLTIADANLASGFPGKNGEAFTELTVCCWLKLETPRNACIVGKWSSGKYSWMCYTLQTGPLRFFQGYNGGVSAVAVDHATILSLATWYHCTFTYRDSDKAYTIRVVDTNITRVGTDKTGTLANNINVEDAPVSIGADGNYNANWYDGKLDGICIFNRILSTTESDELASGSFPVASGTQIPILHYYNRQSRI